MWGGPPTRPESLGRHERLKRRSEFDAVFKHGRRANGRFMTLLAMPTGAGLSRLGIVASRKLGRAAVRNRAKRRIRALFRRHKPNHAGGGLDIVVIPRPELVDAAFASLEADYRSLLRRHGRTTA